MIEKTNTEAREEKKGLEEINKELDPYEYKQQETVSSSSIYEQEESTEPFDFLWIQRPKAAL